MNVVIITAAFLVVAAVLWLTRLYLMEFVLAMPPTAREAGLYVICGLLLWWAA